MHGSPVLTNKQMETTQVVFIYRGPVKRATVITHRKVRLWTNRVSVTGSAGTYIPAHLPRPTEPETRRGARGSVFPHLRCSAGTLHLSKEASCFPKSERSEDQEQVKDTGRQKQNGGCFEGVTD